MRIDVRRCLFAAALMTLRAYRRKDGSGEWGQFRLPHPEGAGALWADIKPAAKLVAVAILMKQLQFAADEGRPVTFSLEEFEAMHIGGRTSIRAGLAELERKGMLWRENRGGTKGDSAGGRGNPPLYQIVGDPLDWLTPGDAVRAGLAPAHQAKVSPPDTFSSPRDTFSPEKVSPRDTPIKTSTTSTSTTSSNGAAQAPPPHTPAASATASDAAASGQSEVRLEDVWTPPTAGRPPMRAKAGRRPRGK